MKHDHGTDGPAMPASVAHRGRDLFDDSHQREERGGDISITMTMTMAITKARRTRRIPRMAWSPSSAAAR